MRLKAHLTPLGERPDGVSVSQVVGRFRADFRLSLMMVVVRRAAAMLLGSGLPGCCVREDVAASSTFDLEPVGDKHFILFYFVIFVTPLTGTVIG